MRFLPGSGADETRRDEGAAQKPCRGRTAPGSRRVYIHSMNVYSTTGRARNLHKPETFWHVAPRKRPSPPAIACSTRRNCCSRRRACRAPRCSRLREHGRRHPRRDLLALQGQGRPVQRDDGARDAAAGGRVAASRTSPAMTRWPSIERCASSARCAWSPPTRRCAACSRWPRTRSSTRTRWQRCSGATWRRRDACVADFEQALRLAARRAPASGWPVPAALAAQGLHALISGLIQNWLLDPEAFALVSAGRRTFNVYLAGLGFERRAMPHEPPGRSQGEQPRSA